MAKYFIEKQLNKARKLIELGNLKKAKSILQPLVEQKNSEAIFLSSTFSFPDEESEDEFEIRTIEMLAEATFLGHAAAAYALAVCYDLGDMVNQDSEYAATLFKKSAEDGYSKAKLNYGLDLIYGSNGIFKNETLGLSLLKQAANEGVDGASDELKIILRNLKKP